MITRIIIFIFLFYIIIIIILFRIICKKIYISRVLVKNVKNLSLMYVSSRKSNNNVFMEGKAKPESLPSIDQPLIFGNFLLLFICKKKNKM